MHYIKLHTSDGEVRWVNLDQVRRVTLIEETSGEPLLAIVFDEGDSNADVRIHGSDDHNRQVIHHVVARLDELAS